MKKSIINLSKKNIAENTNRIFIMVGEFQRVQLAPNRFARVVGTDQGNNGTNLLDSLHPEIIVNPAAPQPNNGGITNVSIQQIGSRMPSGFTVGYDNSGSLVGIWLLIGDPTGLIAITNPQATAYQLPNYLNTLDPATLFKTFAATPIIFKTLKYKVDNDDQFSANFFLLRGDIDGGNGNAPATSVISLAETNTQYDKNILTLSFIKNIMKLDTFNALAVFIQARRIVSFTFDIGAAAGR